jgi:hypothetical protein
MPCRQVADTEGIQGVAQELKIPVSAEACSIDVAARLATPTATSVDFGTVRGVDEARQTFTLVNSGRHPVDFAGKVKKQVCTPNNNS